MTGVSTEEFVTVPTRRMESTAREEHGTKPSKSPSILQSGKMRTSHGRHWRGFWGKFEVMKKC